MARRAQFINAAETTLNGAINDSVTSVVVTDGSIYPAEGDFWVTVEDEIMKVTARSTNTLTVERGADGSTAASHADTTPIVSIITSTNIDQYLEESISWHRGGNYLNEWPGRHRILDTDGNVMGISDFTRNGPSTSQVAENPDGSCIISPGAIGILSAQLMDHAMPSTPFTVTAHMVMTNPTTVGTSGNYVALGFRETTDDDYILIVARTLGNISFGTWNSKSSFNATIDTMEWYGGANEIWMRMTNDGTDMEAFVSTNGRNWVSMGTQAVGTFLNPNRICWGGQSRNKSGHDFGIDMYLEH